MISKSKGVVQSLCVRARFVCQLGLEWQRGLFLSCEDSACVLAGFNLCGADVMQKTQRNSLFLSLWPHVAP